MSNTTERPDGKDENKVEIQKTLNLLSAMSLTVGCIIGSGVFISPKGVLIYTGSVGLNLVIWTLCGLISAGGSLCYIELATVVRESGGEWAYIKEGLGGAPAFLAAWMSSTLIASSSAAICLSSSDYLLSPFFTCGVPALISKLTAVLMIFLIIVISTSIKVSTKILNILFAMKVLALVLIIVGGIYALFTKGTAGLSNSFEGTSEEGWRIALAFYSGLWAYEGWNMANYVTEEVKNPKKTMPAAILGSLLLVTCLYLLVNTAYYVVLTKQEVLESNAVAVDWAQRLVGSWSGILALIISLSMFGSTLSSFYGSSRVLMAVAREGHTVQLLSMVSVGDSSPLISIYVRGALSMAFCAIGDIGNLIDFFSFTSWLFYALSFISLIILRARRRHLPPNKDIFQVPIIIPVVMILVAVYLIVVPVIANPKLPFLYAAIFMLGGLVFYFPFVYCKIKFKWFDQVTLFFQLLCQVGIPSRNL